MQLLIYGSGGFGREVLDIAGRANAISARWDRIGFIDDFRAPGLFCGVELRRLDVVIESVGVEGCEIAIAVGEPSARQRIFQRLQAIGARFATVVDPSAIVSGRSVIGKGVIITPFCLVATEAELADNVVLNARAIIGHDVRIGAHSVVSSMVNVGGATTVGSCSYLGMGVQVKQGLKIGNRTIVGMGSVVHSEIADDVIAIGSPARVARRNVDNVVFR